MPTEHPYYKIQSLHRVAVKAAQLWEAATPGTGVKEAKYERWQKAEAAFTAYVNAHYGDVATKREARPHKLVKRPTGLIAFTLRKGQGT